MATLELQTIISVSLDGELIMESNTGEVEIHGVVNGAKVEISG
jgi:hypothetical protein